MSDTAEIMEQAARWREAGKGVALATVVNTWGSSPRPIGSKLAVDDEGAFVGSVSGGCVEGAVVEEALAAISDGKPRLLGFRRQQRTGLGSRSRLRRQDRDFCRARRMKGRFLDAVIAAGREPRSVALATDIKSGAQLCCCDGEPGAHRGRPRARRGGARRRCARRCAPTATG